MPRLRIIVLDQDTNAPGTRPTYSVVLWADVPAARQAFYANASAVSAWQSAISADNTNLQSGAMVEKQITYSPEGSKTLNQIQSDLQSIWTAYQAVITAYNPWSRYGTTWDGTSWTAGGAA